MERIKSLCCFLTLGFIFQSSLGALTDNEKGFGYNSWQPLQKGDTVYIIAASEGFSTQEELFSHLESAKAVLLRFGLHTRWDVSALADKDPLCPEKAMKTETAFADLRKAFMAPDVKAIWAIRGGRLAHEMWELLEQAIGSFPSKPLLGFSDVTSLHLLMNSFNYPTIHCPLLAFHKDSLRPDVNGLTSLESTVDILMGKTPFLTYSGFAPRNKLAEEKTERFEGRLLGGNLSSLHYYTTIYDTPPKPTIWMIETTDDYTRIDSILEALRRGGMFENALAIIFGQLHEKGFSDSDFAVVQNRCDHIITRFAQKVKVPIFSTILTSENPSFSFGHGEWNHPFPLGTRTVLDVSDPNGQGILLKISAS